MPNLSKVRDLDGDIINGYKSFNSIVISDIDKSLHLLGSKPYSSSDPHYKVIAGAGFDQDEIVLGQISECDRAVKAQFAGLPVRHLLDRGHDDQKLFEHIDDLSSHFVVRLKSSRNSNEFTFNQKGKPQAVKLVDAQLEQGFEEVLNRFVRKNKVYSQARIHLVKGSLTLGEKTYTVIRVHVLNRTQNPVFKEPMMLITNEIVTHFQEGFAIYQAYLRRSKIESVFKFLKTNLGWEDFRVRDFYVIQNLIALCFFVGGYFYENQQEITKDPQAKVICSLAKSKGKVTRHFYLEGLKIIANFLLFQQFIKDKNLTQQDVDQIIKTIS
ncbi:transposase [Dyadobacter frigoris]|uniref:Transposase n=1 Tax=Dyadobacter frigoris TaxID=2576211 RepID=A0A4U6CMK3_9BACT|nr:transposase [Dyadobacter frigoris]